MGGWVGGWVVYLEGGLVGECFGVFLSLGVPIDFIEVHGVTVQVDAWGGWVGGWVD